MSDRRTRIAARDLLHHRGGIESLLAITGPSPLVHSGGLRDTARNRVAARAADVSPSRDAAPLDNAALTATRALPLADARGRLTSGDLLGYGGFVRGQTAATAHRILVDGRLLAVSARDNRLAARSDVAGTRVAPAQDAVAAPGDGELRLGDTRARVPTWQLLGNSACIDRRA